MNSWMIWAVVAVVVFYFLKPSVPLAARLSPSKVQEDMQAEKGLQLIDVRTPDEFRSGHLPGARNLPLDGLDASSKTLDPNKPLIVYCRGGHRSSMALKVLAGKGFTQAKHLEGGISAWSAAGFPVVR
jgi:rhodanese-related sulfurtransferase